MTDFKRACITEIINLGMAMLDDSGGYDKNLTTMKGLVDNMHSMNKQYQKVKR